MSKEDPPGWALLTHDPPTVLWENEIWLVCPLRGFNCARVPRDLFGEEWGTDVMAVHVAIHHRLWR
jgi:hypothetical protein